MEKHLIFNPRVTRLDGKPYIDRYGEEHNLDTYHDAEPFDSEVDALAYIERMGWGSWATVTPAPVFDPPTEDED